LATVRANLRVFAGKYAGKRANMRAKGQICGQKGKYAGGYCESNGFLSTLPIRVDFCKSEHLAIFNCGK
jgi:hypothetical protein